MSFPRGTWERESYKKVSAAARWEQETENGCTTAEAREAERASETRRTQHATTTCPAQSLPDTRSRLNRPRR